MELKGLDGTSSWYNPKTGDLYRYDGRGQLQHIQDKPIESVHFLEDMFLSGAGIRLATGIFKFGSAMLKGIKVSGFIDKLDHNELVIRQERMLHKNTGYNISPISWFERYPSIGVDGTYITDYRAIAKVIGPYRANKELNVGFFSKKEQLSFFKARKLEKALGLEKETLSEGFRFSRVTNIIELHPRNPIIGNDLFMGAGKGLPGGGPELVIDSLPTNIWPWK
ncbi:MAG: hypothetical protein LEGION0398_MBIBDBAK_00198 [Legionellaceae bacterium]